MTIGDQENVQKNEEPPIDPLALPAAISPYLQAAPVRLDLTDSAHLAMVLEAAEALLESYPTAAPLFELETRLAADRDRYPLLVHLAARRSTPHTHR